MMPLKLIRPSLLLLTIVLASCCMACFKDQYILPKPCRMLSSGELVDILEVDFGGGGCCCEALIDEEYFKMSEYAWEDEQGKNYIFIFTLVDHTKYPSKDYSAIRDLIDAGLAVEAVEGLGQEAIWVAAQGRLLVRSGSLTFDYDTEAYTKEQCIEVAELVLATF